MANPAPDLAQPGVLVVDDDPGLLTFLKTLLPQQGFKVWAVADGQDAVELYQREQARIAAVLLDVRMPGLDGPQTLQALQRINPDVACCFMSGFTGIYSAEDLAALGARHCLAKPFRVDEITRILWQCVRHVA